MHVKYVVFYLVCLLPISSFAAITPAKLLIELNNAQDFIQVKPTFSFEVLTKHLSSISILTKEQQLQWLQSLLRVSITLNDFQQAEQTIELMVVYPELKRYPNKLITLLSGSGILLRKMGYPNEAIKLLDCALQQPLSEKQKLSLLLSKGLSLRFLNRNDEAKTLYDRALGIAELNELFASKSSIYNSLGIIALEKNEHELAKSHLLKGFDVSQQVNRRSGKIISGLNLMLLAVLNDDDMLYQRLHSPISQLVESFNNNDRKHFLYWVEAGYYAANTRPLNSQHKRALLEALNSIQDINLHNTLVIKLAAQLGVNAMVRTHKFGDYTGVMLSGLKFCVSDKVS